MSPVAHPPPEGCALAEPATARALRYYRLRAWVLTLIALTCVMLGTGVQLLVLAEDGSLVLRVVASAANAVSLVATGTGIGGCVNAARMRRTLARHPWVACPYRFHELAGHPVVILIDPLGDRAQYTLAITARPGTWRPLANQKLDKLWFAGDPDTGGVLSPPGGEHLVWARPIRLHPIRRHVLNAIIKPDPNPGMTYRLRPVRTNVGTAHVPSVKRGSSPCRTPTAPPRLPTLLS
jgi:hypothetical protein